MQLLKKFQKQKMMRQVLIALLPILAMAVYLFGWRVLVVLAAVTVAGVLAEYAIMYLINKEKAKVTEALFVSVLLYTLTLPPTIPIWIAVVGIVFGVVFAKGAFGGFGQNIFNPALVSRCFVYIAFPAFMTQTWANPFSGFPAGFAQYKAGADLLSSATPMIQLGHGEAIPGTLRLFLGNIAGSMGETSALLILIGAAYLLVTKTASWKIMVGSLVGGGVLSSILYFTGVYNVDPITYLLTGGFLFATVFMATDPVTATRDEFSKYIFGAFVGLLAVVIRVFSLFNEGIMFAVLVSNAFAPLIDRNVKAFRAWRKARAKEVAA